MEKAISIDAERETATGNINAHMDSILERLTRCENIQWHSVDRLAGSQPSAVADGHVQQDPMDRRLFSCRHHRNSRACEG